MADPHDVNRRSAGLTRVNALSERRRMFDDEPPTEMTFVASDTFDDTLVLLLTSPQDPTSEQLRQAAEKAFRRGVVAAVHEREGWEFNVRWAARKFPYHPDQCLIPRSALHGVTFAVHAGWLAVDIVAAPPDATETERLNAVGRLLAELVNAETVAVYRPATEENLKLTPGVQEMLKAGRIGEALTHVADDAA